MIELRKRLVHEGDQLPVPELAKIKIVAVFRAEYKKDGISQQALEIWYLVKV